MLDLERLEREEARLDDRDRAWLRACRHLRGALAEPPSGHRPFEEQVLLLAAFAAGTIMDVEEPHVGAFGAALAAHVQATDPSLFAELRDLPRARRSALYACLGAFARAWRPT